MPVEETSAYIAHIEAPGAVRLGLSSPKKAACPNGGIAYL